MDVFMTINEVSAKTRLSKPTLYRYVHEKTIPHLKIGSRVLFDPKVLAQWLEEKQVGCWPKEETK